MLKIPVFNKEGKEVESFSLDEAILGGKVKKDLLKGIVTLYQANRRQGTHSTKTRSEIAGSTKKPWRQKGTGSARAGIRKSPIWRGGGITFGPKPRDYKTNIPKRMRRSATRSALLAKIQDEELKLINELSFDTPKTKDALGVLQNLGIDRSCLIGVEGVRDAEVKESNERVYKSFRNIRRGKVKVQSVTDFNAYDILKHKNVLITKASFEEMLSSYEKRKAKAE